MNAASNKRKAGFQGKATSMISRMTSSIRFALVRRQWIAALGVLILVGSCRATGVDELSRFPRADATLPDSINVVAWNIHKNDDAHMRHELETFVRGRPADLVFLQECTGSLLDLDYIGGYLAKSWRYPWSNDAGSGVMTLSHVPAVDVTALPSAYREFFVTTPKVSLLTVYPLNDGRTLLAVNVHLLDFERWGTLKLRSQLEDLEAVIAKHPDPVIVAGDFNTWNQERLDLVLAMMRRLDLEEVSGFAARPTTGDQRSTFWNSVLGVDDSLPLDRIYVRGLTARSAEVVPSDASDHKPLLVTFDVPPARKVPKNLIDHPDDRISRRHNLPRERFSPMPHPRNTLH